MLECPVATSGAQDGEMVLLSVLDTLVPPMAHDQRLSSSSGLQPFDIPCHARFGCGTHHDSGVSWRTCLQEKLQSSRKHG